MPMAVATNPMAIVSTMPWRIPSPAVLKSGGNSLRIVAQTSPKAPSNSPGPSSTDQKAYTSAPMINSE